MILRLEVIKNDGNDELFFKNCEICEIKKISDGFNCNKLAYETRSGVLTDFSVFRKPSVLFFKIKDS